MPHDKSGTLVYTDKRIALSLCHSRASSQVCLGLCARLVYVQFNSGLDRLWPYGLVSEK